MALVLTEDAVRRAFPNARPAYIKALLQEQRFLAERGILDNPLRWCHFCGQIGGETDGLTIVRENMHYRANRIVEVFGIGRHSARVSSAEARKLAGDAYALAERVYGLGNPSMARRLGNVAAGDGYNFRGWGPGQVTGREQSVKYCQQLGIDIVAEPDKLEDPAVGLKAFALEWEHRNLNKWADANQLVAVSKGVNLGDPRHKATPNGLKHRIAWFNKAWAVWRMADVDATKVPAAGDTLLAELVLRKGDRGPQVTTLQERLKTLSYSVGWVDGVFGRRTQHAVMAFQHDNHIAVDGIVGPVTWRTLRTADKLDDPERETLTAKDLAARGSRTIANAERGKALALQTGTAGGLAVGGGLAFPQTVAAIPAWLAGVRAFSDDLKTQLDWATSPQGLLTLLGLGAIIYGLRVYARHEAAVKLRVDEARTGANLSK